MKPWTEDDFLERLMPQLRRETRTRTQACPDAELLASFAEDQVAPFVRNAITEHLRECRECSEICAQLLSFEAAPTVGSGDPEWVNAQKRLGNWMDGFLQAKEAPATPMQTLRGQETRKVARLWKWGWAIGTASVLAFVLGYAANRSRTHVAQVPAPAAQVPAQPSSQVQPQENSPAQPATDNPANSVAPDVIVNNTPPPPLAKPNAAVKIQSNAPKPVVPAVKLTPKRTPATSPSTAPAPHRPADVVAQTPSTDNSSQDVHTHSPPQLRPNDRILATGGAQVASSQSAAVSRAAVGQPAPYSSSNPSSRSSAANPTAARNVPVTPSSAPNLLRSRRLQLDSGVRIWVTMTAKAGEDGSFRGKLLQPVTKGGKTVVDRDAEVAGSQSLSDGKLKVTLEQIKVGGTVYQLRKSPWAKGANARGSGSALVFDSGNVLEMWLGATSVYEIGSGR